MAYLYWLLLAVLGLEAVRLSVLKPLSIDEFDYSHASWLIAQGAVPYRDFFDHHLPLLIYVLAPLWRVIGDNSSGIQWLRLAMLPLLGLACLSSWRLAGSGGRRATAGLAPLFLLATPGFLAFATEIRPDGLALALFLAATADLGSATDSAKRAWRAGALLALAVWGSQKVLFYGAGFAIALALDLGMRCQPRRRLLGSPLRFVGGFVLVLSVLVTAVAVAGALPEWWFWCFKWAALHEAGPRLFGWRESLVPVLLQHPWLPVLSSLGYWRSAREWRGSDAAGGDLVLLTALPLSLLSFAIQDAPYAYSLLPFLCLLAVFSARGAGTVARWLEAGRIRFHSREAMVCLGLVIVGWIGLAGVEQRLGESNAAQLDFLRTMDRVIAPEEPVYANSGSAVARPHVGYFPFTNAWIRTMMAQKLTEEVPQAIKDQGAVAWIRDIRFDSLPAGLKRFLESYFIPFGPDLWLWGKRFEVTPGASFVGEFMAIRDGEYFVWPAASLVTKLRVDGRAVLGHRFHLERGQHRVEVPTAGGTFFILKTLRDGEEWTPASGKPSFSRLFG